MIFSTGLKKIYESIDKQPKAKQNTLLNQLNEKIAADKALSYKFNLLESIKNRKNKLNAEEALQFVKALNTKHTSFLKENNSIALFYKSEKKLMEFFNINTRELVSDKVDMFIGKKNNQLNEALVLEYVTNKNLLTKKEYMERVKASIVENFVTIRNNKDEQGLAGQISSIEVIKNNIANPEKKKMVEAALKVVKTEALKKFSSAIEKGYKLRLITERLLMEDGINPTGEDALGLYNNAGKNNRSDEDYEDFEADYEQQTKKFKLPDMTHIKGITAGLNMENDPTVTLSFKLMVYPKAVSMADLMVETKQLKEFFSRYQRPIINKCFYQQNLTLLDPTGINWQVNVPLNNNPQSPADTTAKQIAAQGYYSIPVSFQLVIFIAKIAQPEAYQAEITKMMTAFNDFVPQIDKISDIVTPDLQKSNLTNLVPGRKTTYGKRTGDQAYYKDKRMQGLGDKHTDAVFTGDVEDSEVDKNYDPYFDNNEPVNQSDEGMDDDEFDKLAQQKARKRQ